MITIDILQVRKGDVVRFSKYALRVESEPVLGKGSITLYGRISIDGCPLVTKHFLGGRRVVVERALEREETSSL
jgi:hypothetical protein